MCLLTEYFAYNATSHRHPVGLFKKVTLNQNFTVYFPLNQVCYPLQPTCLRILNTLASLTQVVKKYGLLECCYIKLPLNSFLCLAE